MIVFYNLGIRLYYFLALIFSLFNKKAALWVEGRKNTFKHLKEKIDANDKVIWFHVSSLGEFEQGRPVIEELRKQYPGHKIVLSFFSPSGFEIRKNYTNAEAICYLPLDTKRNAKKFVELVHPEIAVFVKYDYWYYHIKKVKKAGARLVLASGIFRKDQVFFKWYGGWYRKILFYFDQLFVQDQNSNELLNSIGVTHCTVAGDTRFDRVVQIASDSKDIDIVKEFSANATTLVCGSTWPSDETLLIQYLQKTKDNLKLVIAPHEIHEAHIQSIIKLITVPYTLFSQAGEANLEEARILIIDNIGMLSSLYKYGQFSYIGGGFGVGIHNTLEAAVFGIPVIFGPNYQKFREAIDLIDAGGAYTVADYEELKRCINELSNNKDKLDKAGKAAGKYVEDNTGATKSILDYISNK